MADAARGTMDFFAAQAAAKRRTGLLVALFALAWALTVLLADVGITLVLSASERPTRNGYAALTAEADDGAPEPYDRFLSMLLPAAAVVSAIVLLGTGWHALQLGRDGGDAVARMLGGTPIDRNTQDPGERRAVNVLEEMSIAAAIPMPRLYVLSGEESINAFAAGSTPERAVVAVTRGALDALSRDELQGVFAHELSHVLNSDSRLNLRLMAFLGGLTALALLGRILLRIAGSGPSFRRSRDRDKGTAFFLAVGLVFLVAGAIGAFFGRLIRLAVSRQREYLADAAAVQFTRNPSGLAGALGKVAERGSALTSPHAPEAAHFFFVNGMSGASAGILSTHPPLAERLKRLQAGPLSQLAPARPRTAPDAPPAAKAAAPNPMGPLGQLAGPLGIPLGAAGAAGVPLAVSVAASVGRPGPEHLARAEAAFAAFPPELVAATREPSGARALSLALLLDVDPALRERQLAAVRDTALAHEADRLEGLLGAVPRQDRLSLFELALPSLDALSPEQARTLVGELAALAAVDGRITLHEWALQRLVRRRLGRQLEAPRAAVRAHTVGELEVEALELLSALAWAGSREPQAAQAALDAGVRALQTGAAWRLLPRDRIDVGRLDAVLARLDEASPNVKAQLLAASSACVLADGRVTVAEAELLRTVAASMGLPMPALPVGAGAQAVTAA